MKVKKRLFKTSYFVKIIAEPFDIMICLPPKCGSSNWQKSMIHLHFLSNKRITLHKLGPLSNLRKFLLTQTQRQRKVEPEKEPAAHYYKGIGGRLYLILESLNLPVMRQNPTVFWRNREHFKKLTVTRNPFTR